MKFPGNKILILAVFIALLAGFTSCMRGGKLAAIKITPINPVITPGAPLQLTATATFTDGTSLKWTTDVQWQSSSDLVSISNSVGSNGLASVVTAMSGTIRITATDIANNISDTTIATVKKGNLVSITVSPVDLLLSVATATFQYNATGRYDDGSTEDLSSLVTWKSSNTAVATVSNTEGSVGVVTPVAAGITMITATDPTESHSGNGILTVE